MQLTNIAARLMKPFANSGNKAAIPQTGTDPARASYETGFTPLNMTPIAAGGVPPSGRDMNGILYDLSNAMMWQQAMGILPYDATVSYPNGALVVYGGMLWKCLADDTLNVTPVNGAKWTSDIHTEYVKKTGDTITGTLTAPTPAQFDNDTSLATTAFVQRALGNYAGSSNISAGQTIQQGNVGKVTIFGSTATGQAIYLPSLDGLPNGATIVIHGYGAFDYAIDPQGGQDILASGTVLTSLPMKGADSAVLYKESNTRWVLIGGTVQEAYSPRQASSLAVNGYQKLPSGLIMQWGDGTSNASGQLSITFPIAFTSSDFAYRIVCMHSGTGPAMVIEQFTARTLTGTSLGIFNTSGLPVQGGVIRWFAIGL